MAVQFSDGMLLDIIDRFERLGESYGVIAKAYGTTRSSVAGLVKRIRDQLNDSERAPLLAGETRAMRPENRNGGMPELWWEAGLALQVQQSGCGYESA